MKLKLTDVRIAFPRLFTAEKFQDGPAKFSAMFLVPKDSEQGRAIDALLTKVAAEKWGAKAPKILAALRPIPNRCCVQDGDVKTFEGAEGNWCLRAGNTTRPTVLDTDKTPLAEADGKPYSGCFVNAVVDFYAYETAGNGIGCSLMGVQYARKGDAFAGGGVASADDFDDVTAGATADDLT